MVGKYQIQLGSDQLISGMSSSDYATDGALGISSVMLNPYIQPGIIKPLAASTDISSNVVGNIIASCEDSNATSPNNRYLIDDASGAANYYSDNGTALTKIKTGTSTGTTYVQGKSDFISFSGFFYGSSPTVLNKWDGAASLSEAFKTFTDANASHPMIVYRGLLFVGDGNSLSTLATDNTTYTTAANGFLLDSKEKIVALGIDPATGLMMISVQTVYDISDTIPSLKAVYLYDGVSAQFTRKILVDDLVTAFYNVEGAVYMGSGQALGVWNGNGVTFLRKLQNVGLVNTDLLYKHHFTNIGRILHVVDGQTILSYGSVTADKKGFFYTATNPANSNHLTIVYPRGSNRIAIGYTTAKVASFDFSSTGSASGFSLYFNNIYFPRPIFVHRMRLITTGVTRVDSSNVISIFILDEKGAQLPISTANRIRQAPTGTTYVFDFDFGGAKCQAVQPELTIANSNYGLVRAIIYYDIAE